MAKVLTSASVLCYVNGSLYGLVSDFSFRSTTARRTLYGIDSIQPFELAPTQTKVSGSLKVYRNVAGGGAEGGGFTAHFGNLSAEQYFSLILVDRQTGLTVFKAQQCSVLSQNWEFPVRGIVTGAIEWEGLEWTNEAP